MLLFLLLAAALWALGWRLGTPYQARFISIGLLYVVFLAALVVLPEETPLRTALGGSARQWLAIGILGALAYAYSLGLRRLRRHVRPENRPRVEPAPADAPFGEAELERYARHIVLREIGGPGQRRLKDARVLVVGAGGLGAPVLQYLAAAGVGTIGVIDDDRVEHTNLQRQVIHSERTLGQAKSTSAAAAMRAINPFIRVETHETRLAPENAASLIAGHDLVLDGSDNFATRYLVNATCARLGIPLVAGAITQWEGQVSLYDPARGGPCYECVFPEAPAAGLAPSCAEAGVVAPLPGILGSIMALEAIKHVTGAGETLRGRLLIYDGLHAEARVITLKPRADCPVCGGGARDLEAGRSEG